jgi:hypothetical protein
VSLKIPVSTGLAASGGAAGPPSAPAPAVRAAPAGTGPLRDPVAARPAGGEAVPQSRILIAPLEDRAAGEIYSATQIRTFFECPGLYRLRYSLGLEGETGGSFGGGILPGDGKSDPAGDWQDLDGDRAADATLAGEITHALLKQVGAQPPSDAQVGTILGGFGESSGPVADAARSGLEAFLGSSYGRSVMAAPEFHNEFQLAMMFDGALLTGIIDRVWKRDGWELVDYKTDRVAAEDLAARAARYEPQMGVYAMLASAFFAQPSIRATLLFLRHPGQPQVIEFSAGKLQTFREKLSDALRRIRSGDFSALPDRPGGGPPAGDRCASCPFRDSGPECPLRPGGTSHP